METKTTESSGLARVFESIENSLNSYVTHNFPSIYNINGILYYILVTFIRIVFYSTVMSIIPQIIYHLVLTIFTLLLFVIHRIVSCFTKSELLDQIVIATSRVIKNSYKSRKFHCWSFSHYISLLGNLIFGILVPIFPQYLLSTVYKNIDTHVELPKVLEWCIYGFIYVIVAILSLEWPLLIFPGMSIYMIALIFISIVFCLVFMYKDLTSDDKQGYFTKSNDTFGIKLALFNLFECSSEYLWGDKEALNTRNELTVTDSSAANEFRVTDPSAEKEPSNLDSKINGEIPAADPSAANEFTASSTNDKPVGAALPGAEPVKIEIIPEAS